MTDRRLVWIDLETGGLDEHQVPIFEVAAILTEPDLTEVERFHAVVCHPVDFTISPWAYRVHSKSGLLDEVCEATKDTTEVEAALVAFIEKADADKPLLAGSSVHFDRKFLAKYMPKVLALLGYRNFDVSTLSESVFRWAPHLQPNFPTKRELHRAMPDLEDSITLARFIRDRVYTNTP